MSSVRITAIVCKSKQRQMQRSVLHLLLHAIAPICRAVHLRGEQDGICMQFVPCAATSVARPGLGPATFAASMHALLRRMCGLSANALLSRTFTYFGLRLLALWPTLGAMLFKTLQQCTSS
jgi:hypothetical protein